MVQIGNDVGGICDDYIVIHQHRNFNAAINGFQSFMVRPEQSVDCLVIQALVFKNHAHFARKWAERTIIQFDHDIPLSSELINESGSGPELSSEHFYSITLSACATNSAGTLRPSSLPGDHDAVDVISLHGVESRLCPASSI
jgi:hypothetical protein